MDKNLIKKAGDFGFKITQKRDKYYSTTACQHCNDIFTEEIFVNNSSGNINFPIRCEKCRSY